MATGLLKRAATGWHPEFRRTIRGTGHHDFLFRVVIQPAHRRPRMRVNRLLDLGIHQVIVAQVDIESNI